MDLCPRAVKEEDPQQRFIKVLKWYLSGYHIKPKVHAGVAVFVLIAIMSDSSVFQFVPYIHVCCVSAYPQGVKKPYNPILGETFRAWHEHADGSCTSMVCEQVRTYVHTYVHACMRLCVRGALFGMERCFV